jgi:putative ABC transport system permease protein
MRFADSFSTAFGGVRRSGSRALLTMLGIIIGVGAVVLMSSIGESMKGVILGQISSLGAKSMVIFPGREEGGAGAISTGFDSLTFEDIDALKRLGTIESVAPVVNMPGTVSYENESGSPDVLGVSPEFFRNQNIEVTAGRFIDASDEEGARSVALVAPEVVEKYFGNVDPVGRRMKVGERFFTVIGVTKALGSQFFQSADNRVYVPLAVARSVTGQKHANFVTMLAVDDFPSAFVDVKSLLRERHDIVNPKDDPKEDDFIVHSSEEANDILSGVSVGLTAFITMIAAISLLVGGIGIMNIMLVSVTERTREIGLRKAVGGRSRDILLQFLIESVLLTFLGGVIGLVLGIALAFGISRLVAGFLSTYIFAVSVPSVLASLAMAAGTGLIFGISPARRAAALPPMEALRYE